MIEISVSNIVVFIIDILVVLFSGYVWLMFQKYDISTKLTNKILSNVIVEINKYIEASSCKISDKVISGAVGKV